MIFDIQMMARTPRAAPSCCGFPSAFCLALRSWPSSGCSGQPSPRVSLRVGQPLIRSTFADRSWYEQAPKLSLDDNSSVFPNNEIEYEMIDNHHLLLGTSSMRSSFMQYPFPLSPLYLKKKG